VKFNARYAERLQKSYRRDSSKNDMSFQKEMLSKKRKKRRKGKRK